MFNDQISGQLRQLLQAVGAILTTLGFLAPGVADNWITTIMQVIGPLGMIGGVVWSILSNRKSSIIASASAIPEVKGMTITNSEMAQAARVADPATVVRTTGEAPKVAA